MTTRELIIQEPGPSFKRAESACAPVTRALQTKPSLESPLNVTIAQVPYPSSVVLDPSMVPASALAPTIVLSDLGRTVSLGCAVQKMSGCGMLTAVHSKDPRTREEKRWLVSNTPWRPSFLLDAPSTSLAGKPYSGSFSSTPGT
jgi:hypothetical protein